MEYRWYGNLQRDAYALVILLHIGCIKPDTRGVTFRRNFEGLNNDQYFVVLSLSKEVEAINAGLKVQFIHCLRLIVQTTLQLFFDAFSRSC